MSFFIVNLNNSHILQKTYCFDWMLYLITFKSSFIFVVQRKCPLPVLYAGSCVVVSYEFTPGFFELRQQGALHLPKLLLPLHSPLRTPPLHLSLPRILWKIWTSSVRTLVDQARTEHRCRASCGKWAEHIIYSVFVSVNHSTDLGLSCNIFPNHVPSLWIDNSN